MSSRTWLRFFFLLLVLWRSEFAAQDQQGPKLPSVEEIDELVKTLEASGPENMEALVAIYKEARAARKSAADEDLKFKGYESERREAAALLGVLRAELSSLPAEVELVRVPGATLQEIEAQLQKALAEQATTKSLVEELTQIGKQRLTRNTEIPLEISAAEQALALHEEALAATPPGPDTKERRILLLALIEEQRALLQALKAEDANYVARRELLPLRLDRALRRGSLAEKAVSFWRTQADAKRTADGEAAAREAERKLEEVLLSFPALKELAARNHELASLRSGETGLPTRLSNERTRLEATRERLNETKSRYSSALLRVEVGGLTEAMGLILRRDLEWLLTETKLRDLSHSINEPLSEALLELIAIEEEQASVGDLSLAHASLMAALNLDEVPASLSDSAYGLLVARRDAQNSARDGLGELIELHYNHKELSKQLADAVLVYRGFIEKRILWVRSANPNPLGSVLSLSGHTSEILLAFFGLEPRQQLVSLSTRNPMRSLVVVLVWILLLLCRGYLRSKRAELGLLVRSHKTDRYLWTLRALIQTMLLALLLPLATWSFGWLLSGSSLDLERALGLGLKQSAWLWLVLRFLRGVISERGVGKAHFRWPAGSLALVRKELRWFEPLVVLLSLIVFTLDRQSNGGWSNSVGRLAFLALMLVMAFFFKKLLSPDGSLWALLRKSDKSLLGRTHALWYWLSTAVPLALCLLALGGYYYTALQFELRLLYTIAFALGLVLINGLLLRWLYIARRHLAVNQALEARARREEEEAASEGASSEPQLQAIDADKVDIPGVDARTRQLFKSSLTLAAFLGLYFIWASVLPALRGLDRVQLLPTFQVLSSEADLKLESVSVVQPKPSNGSLPTAPMLPMQGGTESASSSESAPAVQALPVVLTLADVLLALVFLLLTTVAAKNLPALLELSLLQTLPLDSGGRYAVSTIARYLIIVIGVSVISGALGIGWQNIQWLVAALTFGLAFGLQEIFANFVSGLIILVERPVRVGDIVTVGGTEGRVTQLRMRATTVLDRDLREFLIPNKEFITGSVINWTLSDPVTRLIIPVGIAYGSDTVQARRLLLEVAKLSPFTVSEPAPQAFFSSFGESSLDFELRVFLFNRDNWSEATSQICFAIDAAFRKAGIEIAFPQRDIHIRTPGKVPTPDLDD